MDRRERLVFQINKLANAITLQKLVVVETLMRELQGGNSGEVQLMIEEFLKKIAPSKLAATGESFYVAADENSFVARNNIKLKKDGGIFDYIGDLFYERMLDKGNRVEGSCAEYRLETYELLEMVSDETIMESLGGRASTEVTLRGFSNFINDLIENNSQVNGRSYIGYIEDKYGQLMAVNVHFNLQGSMNIFAVYLQNPRNWNKGDIVVVPFPQVSN
ncbi:hypothetical protein H6784_05685 [Candidatus Nomurabacteria bacterium]|nr:hypothetical protein [Candidatus Kaiserbacteria bacterium]MCB9814868.1 hypothetical protein [Candidatus Nomurabacteria bacterium]